MLTELSRVGCRERRYSFKDEVISILGIQSGRNRSDQIQATVGIYSFRAEFLRKVP